MSEENMNNCKAEPIHGEPMLRDPIDDLSRLVGMIDLTQDSGVKVVLRATIINMIQKHLGIDNENIREMLIKQFAVDVARNADDRIPTGEAFNIMKAENEWRVRANQFSLFSLWKRQENPEISYILFQHLYDFIKENDR